MTNPVKIESCIAYALTLLVLLLWRYSGLVLASGIGVTNTYRLSLPPGPKGWPLFGNIFQMNREMPWLQYFSWSRKYGELVYVDLAGKKLLFINSYKAAHELLTKQAEITSDRPDMPMINLIGWDHTLAMIRYGDSWKAHNRLFKKYLQPKDIPKYYPASIRSTNLLLKEMLADPKGFRQSIRNGIGAFIMSIVYGHDVALFSADEYVLLAEAALKPFKAAGNLGAFYVDLFPSLMYIPEWLMPSWAFKKKASLWRPIVESFKNKPYEMIQHRMHNGTANPCIATKMIAEEVETASMDQLKEREIVVKGSIASVYAGGTDTTEAAIATFFMLMTLHPETQKKAQEELDHVLAEGTMPRMSDRPQLPYIEAICMELLRWHPIAPQAVPHRTTQDITYNGYLIPEGTALMVNLWTILHSEDTYPDRPFEFLPERFLDSQGKLNESVFHPSKAVFGFGRRMCPGRHLVDAQIWLVVASVLRVYNLTRAVDKTGNPIPLNAEFTNGIISNPKKYMCDIQPRSDMHRAMIDALELGNGYILE